MPLQAVTAEEATSMVRTMMPTTKLGVNPEQAGAIPGAKPTMSVEEVHEMIADIVFGLQITRRCRE